MWLLLALAADRLPLAQRLVDGLFPTGDGYAARLTLGRRAQLGDEMVYRSTIGRSPAGPYVEAGVRWSHVCQAVPAPWSLAVPWPCAHLSHSLRAVCAPPTQPACRVRKLSWHAGRLGRYGTVGHDRRLGVMTRRRVGPSGAVARLATVSRGRWTAR